MLIIDMPMPKHGGCHIAVDWDGHSFVCPIKRKTCDYFFSNKRPDWCPIKGELVRCGERKYHWENGGDCVAEREWFCADGERKDDSRFAPNSAYNTHNVFRADGERKEKGDA